MRTITYGGAVSLDGFIAGPDGALDWLQFSADVQQITSDYWKDVDTILMGRKTYDVAVAMRPAPTRQRQTRGADGGGTRTGTRKMRTYVFSRTLGRLDDPEAELVTEEASAFVRGLKQQPGKGICLMGGGELAQTLLAAGLVDEVGLNIHPLLLGAGIPVFRDPGHRIPLALTECRPLAGGCILARYKVLAGTVSS